MGKAPKRFIKKVPPSGAAPVFKLTLPHRVVHSHLSHLIDSEFEIATAPDATHSWQGTIAPRRNKDRSEYTLQGWRLFAEAHRVQPGDQVSFELVSPRRLVVQVISTEDTKLATRSSHSNDESSPMHEEDPGPQIYTSPMDQPNPGFLGASTPLPLPANFDPRDGGAWQASALTAAAAAAQEDVRSEPGQEGQEGLQPFVRPTGSRQNSSQQDLGRPPPLELPGLSCPHPLSPCSPATPRMHQAATQGVLQSEPGAGLRERNLESGPHTTRQLSWPAGTMPQHGSVPNLFRQTPVQGVGPDARASSAPGAALGILGLSSRDTDEGFGAQGGDLSRPPSNSNTRLNFQLLNLTSTIQALQSDLHVFETRAQRAEFETAQMKLLFGELRTTLDRQARSVLHAGESLEQLTVKLASPSFLAAADQDFAEKVLGLQSEMFGCINKLKSSLMRLLSVDFHSSGQPEQAVAAWT